MSGLGLTALWCGATGLWSAHDFKEPATSAGSLLFWPVIVARPGGSWYAPNMGTNETIDLDQLLSDASDLEWSIARYARTEPSDGGLADRAARLAKELEDVIGLMVGGQP